MSLTSGPQNKDNKLIDSKKLILYVSLLFIVLITLPLGHVEHKRAALLGNTQVQTD